MAAYEISEINRRIEQDPQRFVEECDLRLQESIVRASEKILGNMKKSPVVLLSGPSGSGKTTTAMKIEEELESRGVSTVTISMDNYFKTLDPETAPRTPEGEIDFESPELLDMELLNKHFTALERGEKIRIPHFIFSLQERSATRFTPLRLRENEVAIFEGIHALNDCITYAHPEAVKLYISASSHFAKDGALILESSWLRLTRRVVRDVNFRGTDAYTTLKLWANVLRGEKLYIDPYIHKADISIDSTLPYEVSLLKRYAEPLFKEISPSTPEYAQLEKISQAFEHFTELSPKYVSSTSLLREFIGGSAYFADNKEDVS